MISTTPRHCTIDHYAPAWALGTGLRVGLPPGKYKVTGEDRINGRFYLRIEDKYRIASCETKPGS